MSTDRPDDRADVIEAAAKVVRENTCCSGLCADSTSQRTARALHDAGLLATPATYTQWFHALADALDRAERAEAEVAELRATAAVWEDEDMENNANTTNVYIIRAVDEDGCYKTIWGVFYSDKYIANEVCAALNRRGSALFEVQRHKVY